MDLKKKLSEVLSRFGLQLLLAVISALFNTVIILSVWSLIVVKVFGYSPISMSSAFAIYVLMVFFKVLTTRHKDISDALDKTKAIPDFWKYASDEIGVRVSFTLMKLMVLLLAYIASNLI